MENFERLHADKEKCPKCESVAPLLRWCPGYVSDMTGMVVPERLKCICWQCGFSWYRLPRDAKDEPAP